MVGPDVHLESGVASTSSSSSIGRRWSPDIISNGISPTAASAIPVKSAPRKAVTLSRSTSSASPTKRGTQPPIRLPIVVATIEVETVNDARRERRDSSLSSTTKGMTVEKRNEVFAPQRIATGRIIHG